MEHLILRLASVNSLVLGQRAFYCNEKQESEGLKLGGAIGLLLIRSVSPCVVGTVYSHVIFLYSLLCTHFREAVQKPPVYCVAVISSYNLPSLFAYLLTF